MCRTQLVNRYFFLKQQPNRSNVYKSVGECINNDIYYCIIVNAQTKNLRLHLKKISSKFIGQHKKSSNVYAYVPMSKYTIFLCVKMENIFNSYRHEITQ